MIVATLPMSLFVTIKVVQVSYSQGRMRNMLYIVHSKKRIYMVLLVLNYYLTTFRSRENGHFPVGSSSLWRSPGTCSLLHYSMCWYLWEDWHEDTDIWDSARFSLSFISCSLSPTPMVSRSWPRTVWQSLSTPSCTTRWQTPIAHCQRGRLQRVGEASSFWMGELSASDSLGLALSCTAAFVETLQAETRWREILLLIKPSSLLGLDSL